MFTVLLCRFRSSREHLPRLNTYIYISGLISGIHDMAMQIDSIALHGSRRGQAKNEQPAEDLRLRAIYATGSWEETNKVLEDSIFGLLKRALDGDTDLDEAFSPGQPRRRHCESHYCLLVNN
jgi:hypothetical protein